MTTTAIRWEKDNDGIVTLTLDDPGQSVNTMNALYLASLRDSVTRLVAEKDSIKGVIITSAKKTFFAGADLTQLIEAKPEQAKELFDSAEESKRHLRALETLGKPVVAALNGTALGGGFEIALACHRRIAIDDPKSEFGLPEVTLGLLPGSGGIVRTVASARFATRARRSPLAGDALSPRARQRGGAPSRARRRSRRALRARQGVHCR
jgi:3-hydroxyacyl-CoA dehydrogenase/enoyl-CoA hydratase/3-hydroxybutyryl-CoA epimerase